MRILPASVILQPSPGGRRLSVQAQASTSHPRTETAAQFQHGLRSIQVRRQGPATAVALEGREIVAEQARKIFRHFAVIDATPEGSIRA